MPKKLKRLDKRGVDLTLNTIIVAVLVILVLVVVAVFFVGGFRQLTDRLKGTFFETTAGTSQAFAVELCRQYCDQVERLPEKLRAESTYCQNAFIIDGLSNRIDQENNKYDKVYTCSTNRGKEDGIKKKYAAKELGDLGVPCTITCK